MDYQAALAYISSFGRFGSRPGLERMNWLLERLGHPDKSLRFIHIGGTNGKGSTSALVYNILRAAGYRVGMFTSPYLESFTNRIGVQGEDIKVEHLVALVKRLRPLFDEINQTALGPITQFEVTTTLALVYYQQLELDFVVWEVGLGGRLDATNVVKPIVSVITNIGRDHTEVLGETITAIASEKAGIIKPKVPLITAVQDAEAWQVIAAHAAALEAPVYLLGVDFSYRRNSFTLQGQSFDYRDSQVEWRDLRLHLLGEHQCKNAATALAVTSELRKQGFNIDENACRRGLEATRWLGRLEIMCDDPLVIVDGAHNPHGTRVLQQALQEYFPGRPITMVLGILRDKERQEMLAHLLPLASRVIFAAPSYGRAIDPALLLKDAAAYKIPASTAATVAEAIDAALAGVAPNEVVLVAGSLYTVAEARERLKEVCK
ncbi:MAG: bifunctional folylpolyglutamate synthase/dihydrofolate synthase [Firmicutes bacterium]|nr:bifunctional folylpolyglutamate synthase/dihydrofolate synthase [Bacillota bacterium]